MIIGKGGMKENTERACKELQGNPLCIPSRKRCCGRNRGRRDCTTLSGETLECRRHSGTAGSKEFGPLIVSIDAEGNNLV